jgi:Protein of unknown function (DUF3305)
MSSSELIELGVVIERRKIDNPWQEYSWLPVAVFTGAEPIAQWREISRDATVVQYHAATLPVEIFRSDTEAYQENLGSAPPSVYVVLSEDEEGDGQFPYFVQSVTLSPYEAQDVLDSGEEIVERVVMPEPVLAWLQEFIDEHHVDKPFKKRKRDRLDLEEQKFGKDPIFLDPHRDGKEPGNG